MKLLRVKCRSNQSALMAWWCAAQSSVELSTTQSAHSASVQAVLASARRASCAATVLVLATLASFAGAAQAQAQATFNIWSGSVNEQDGRARISVQVTPRATTTLRVSYATYPGSATNGSDYYGTSGVLTFRAGESVKTFDVPILDDTAIESIEKINLRIFKPSTGVIDKGAATMTIVDNDRGTLPEPISFAWLEDGSGGPLIGSGPTNSLGYPRIMMTETQAMGPDHSRFNKYPIIATAASNLWGVENVFKGQPVFYHRQFNPRQFMEWKFDGRDSYCSQGLSAPFEKSVSATNLNACEMWAGHFLYTNTSRLTAAMASGARVINVRDGSKFTVGKWVVIYDGANRTDFRNAEHAQVTGVNGNSITLGARYNSSPRSHPVNAWVRQHEDGDYDPKETRYWVYNLATTCPRDANGKRFVDHLVPWLVSNLKVDVDGTTRDIQVGGLTFDVDTYIDVFSRDGRISDVNNDGIPDRGVSPNGEHWWGKGVDEFYRLLRNRLPNFQIVGGVRQSFGFDHLDGVQIEGFPNGEKWRKEEEFTRLNSMLSTYFYRMFRAPNRNRAQVQLLMKWGTPIYPTHTPARRTSKDPMAPLRLGLGLTAMDGGVFHQENSADANYLHDTWYDEYAVVNDRSAADFGTAVDKFNVPKARRYTGWLGQPTTYGRRVVDTSAFSASAALLTQTFDQNINGWRGTNVDLSRSTAQKISGNGGLAISRMKTYRPRLYQAKAIGPGFDVTNGTTYTVTFAARASEDRWIQARVGSHGEDFLAGPRWRRYVMSFTATETGSRPIEFFVGQHSTEVYIDSIRVFRGNANVFRRYFQNGAIIANGTSKWVTVDLGKGYRRIRGTQAPQVNDGSDLPARVSVPPYDAIFALKK